MVKVKMTLLDGLVTDAEKLSLTTTRKRFLFVVVSLGTQMLLNLESFLKALILKGFAKKLKNLGGSKVERKD